MYYDVFEYPLTAEELYTHNGKGLSVIEFSEFLNELVSQNLLSFGNGFYHSPLAQNIPFNKRISGNEMALKMMPTAVKWGKRIYNFPFVRSVNLSGSLSKNYFDSNSDIDFFIVTKTNRLWICRTLLILYWKLSSAKNKKYFCTNYFVDETVLEMEEKNQFTATELSYLVPVVNASSCKKILENNPWVNNYINNKALNIQNEINAGNNILKRLIEFLLNNKVGNLIENWLLKKTIERWRKKYPDLSDEDFELQFRSRRNVCKRHSRGFQNKVLNSLQQKINDYQTAKGINLI